jgi:hypothetical protein
MENWVFDYATCMVDLKNMWGNVAASLKHKGRFIGVRVKGVRTEYMSYGKYEIMFKEVEEISDGLKYRVRCLT